MTVTLDATASSGLTVSYTSETPTICTVAGSMVSSLIYGNCTIQASQAGNAQYAAAAKVSQTFSVNHASQTITFPAIASQTIRATVSLDATASSGLAVSYASTTAAICTVSGVTASLLTAGTCSIQATQAGNAIYSAATAATQSFKVVAAAAPPTVALTASPTSIASGGNSTLTWTSMNATSCTASGGWTGTEATSGIQSVSPTVTTTYSLTCTGAGGTSSPAGATVTVTGNGSGGPSAPTNLQLINQGGPANNSSLLTNYQQVSWNAATQGAFPISYYQIYRNGAPYDTTTNTSYADTNAPGSNDPTWVMPATVYTYQVAAVDTHGNIGPQAAEMSVYSYQNGQSNWDNADLSYGNIVEDYASVAGNPQGGIYDISISNPIGGGFQPTAHAPQAPQWDLEIGAFDYLTIGVNPGSNVNFQLPIGTVSRLPPGDVYGWHPALNVFDYGPAPAANTWATYQVPLNALGMGISTFTGSISGTTLTVTAVLTNPTTGVDAGGFITGPGVPPGTYITGYGQHNSIGTFTVAGSGISSSTSVPGETMTFQRTSLYKFGMQPNVNGLTFYLNNIGFTTTTSSGNVATKITGFMANPATIVEGRRSTLAWSSTNATSCTASGGWMGTEAPSGTLSVSPTSTTTYTLTCTGAGGTSASASATVTVSAAPAPTVTLSASPTSISSGSNSTLTWSSTNATSCTAGGGWTGTETTSGTLSVSPTSTTTYTLTCTGAGGTTSPASATVFVTTPGLTKVGTGEYEIFYLMDGTIYGYGSPGLLGLGNNPTEIAIPPVPIATPSGLKFVDVQGGMHQSLALDQNGHVWTWGDAADGRAGDGQTHTTVNATPYMITKDNLGNDFSGVVAIYASYVFDAAIKSDGTVWVWGDCTAADTGDGTAGAIALSPTQVPLSLPTGVKITQLGVGDGIIALASDGAVWAWGQSENVDDLGTGNPDYENPHQVAGLPGNIKQVAWGAGHYALTADGELYGWGYRGAYLGIGDGVNTWQPTPTAISLTSILGLSAPVAFVASSSLTTHVILTDGSLWGWGSAGNGGIGDGEEPDWATANPPYAWDWGAYDMMVMKPVRIVPSVSNFKAVFANSTYDFYIYALTTDGQLFSWGRNKTGVLGNGVYPMSANGNFGTASNMCAVYPNSWDVSLATEVTPMTTKGIPTNSPYCVANPSAADCF